MSDRHEVAGSLTFVVPDFRKEERAGAIISLLVHVIAFFFLFRMGGREQEAVVQRVVFEPPRPILQKSFELAKRPEISEVQMEMLQSVAMAPEVQLSQDMFVTGTGTGSSGGLLVGAAPTSLGAMSRAGLEGFSGVKAAAPSGEQVKMVELSQVAAPMQEALSLSQELLNVQDLDIGRYQAIIIQDPENKRKIRGFFNMTVIDYDVSDKNRDRFPTAVEELMRYIRDHTQINARIQGTTIELSDPSLMEKPFIYMTGNDAVLQISDTEKKNLGDYLKSGGFLFAEEIRQSDPTTGLDGKEAGVSGTPFDRQFKALMRDPLVLGSEGDKWQKIPNNHPLYSCFYDFPDGPPMGGAPNGNVFALEMLELRGRVAVIFSDLNISWYWGDQYVDARERGLQFGVNLIVFALTQPGGIANVTQFTH